MGAVNTNAISLAYIRETVLGELPAAGVAEYLEPNDITEYGAQITTTVRNPISKNRTNKKGTITDMTSSMSFTQDTTASLLLAFLQGAIYSYWHEQPWARGADLQVTAGTGFTVLTPLTTAPPEGAIVYVRGFFNEANNGLKIVDAGATTTSIPTTDAASLVAETGANTSSIYMCGIQGTAGDIQIDANGNVISTTLDFTTLGLQVGQGLYIGGLDADTKFNTAVNGGLCRIRKIEANMLTIDKKDGIFVADAGAGKTIQLYFGWFIKDVPVDDPFFKDHSFAFELAYPGLGDSDVDAYEYSTGNFVNTYELSLPLADKSTSTIATFGMDTLPLTETKQAWTYDNPLFSEAFSTPNDFIRLRLTKYDETGLSTLFKDCTLSFGNNAGGEGVLGKMGPAFTNYGNFDVSISCTVVFTNKEIPRMIRNNCTCTMDFCLINSDGAFYVDIPSLTLGDGSKSFPVNEKVKIALSNSAFGDTEMGHTIGITYFPYIPTERFDACA